MVSILGLKQFNCFIFLPLKVYYFENFLQGRKVYIKVAYFCLSLQVLEKTIVKSIQGSGIGSARLRKPAGVVLKILMFHEYELGSIFHCNI